MAKQIPSYLKLVRPAAETQELEPEDLATLNKVCRAFEAATGWPLEHTGAPLESSTNLTWSAPANPGVGASPGLLRIVFDRPSHAARGQSARDESQELASAIADLWRDLTATRVALRQREAELAAAGVAFVAHAGEANLLAERLEAALRFGAEHVGCQAAALYLLDPATTELKLRSCWGLPQSRFVEQARGLRGAAADLEALVGHAVVLSDDQLWDLWKAPEQFSAGICVPVSSPTMPLGTLWFFAREPRDFTDRDTELVEVVAGRVAADLDRELLLAELTRERAQQRSFSAAQGLLDEQLPSASPVMDRWQVAARRGEGAALGGPFYDWFAGPEGALTIIAGQPVGLGVEGALAATAVRAAARAASLSRDALSSGLLSGPALDVLVASVNSVLWTCSAGEQAAGLAIVEIAADAHAINLAAAGPVAAMIVGKLGYRLLSTAGAPLGSSDLCSALVQAHEVRADEAVVLVASRALVDCDDTQREALLAEIAGAAGTHLTASADDLAEAVLRSLDGGSASDAPGAAAVVLKPR